MFIELVVEIIYNPDNGTDELKLSVSPNQASVNRQQPIIVSVLISAIILFKFEGISKDLTCYRKSYESKKNKG